MLSPALSSSPTLSDNLPQDAVKPAFGVVSDSTVSPRSYFFKRLGGFNRDARIFDIGVEYGEEPKLVVDQSPTFNPFRSSKGRFDTLSRLALTDPTYFVEGRWTRFLLWQGSGPQGVGVSSQQLMDIKCEGIFNQLSQYSEVGGQGRVTTMFKAKELPTRQTDRTFTDFDGNIYQWIRHGKRLITMQCLRSDGVVIATFRHEKYSFPEAGTFVILQPVPISALYLLLSTCYVKWRDEQKKKH